MTDFLNKLASEPGTSIFVCATGAGAGIQDRLWQVPGASNYFTGAQFPYAKNETDQFLGFSPEKYTSPETALDLALASYYRACLPESSGGMYKPFRRRVGLGLCATAASTVVHKGEHRICIAVVTDDQVLGLNYGLTKGAGIDAREEDGYTADYLGILVLEYVLTGTWEEQYWDLALPQPYHEEAVRRVLARPFFQANGQRLPAPTGKLVLYPGSFNPPHQGHFSAGEKGFREFCSIHEGRNAKLVYATTANPPHKLPLSAQRMMQRAAWMRGHDFLLTEGDPTFLDKARRHPGCALVMGADAFQNLLDPHWLGEPTPETVRKLGQLVSALIVLNRDHQSATTVWEKSATGMPFPNWIFPVEADWPESSSAIRAAAEAK